MSIYHPKLLFSFFLLINLLPFCNSLSYYKLFNEFADLFQDEKTLDDQDVRKPCYLDDLLVQRDSGTPLLLPMDERQLCLALVSSGFSGGLKNLRFKAIGIKSAALGWDSWW